MIKKTFLNGSFVDRPLTPRRKKKEGGQGLLEYALILVLIAIVSVIVVTVVGGQTSNGFLNVSNALSGRNGNGNTGGVLTSYVPGDTLVVTTTGVAPATITIGPSTATPFPNAGTYPCGEGWYDPPAGEFCPSTPGSGSVVSVPSLPNGTYTVSATDSSGDNLTVSPDQITLGTQTLSITSASNTSIDAGYNSQEGIGFSGQGLGTVTSGTIEGEDAGCQGMPGPYYGPDGTYWQAGCDFIPPI